MLDVGSNTVHLLVVDAHRGAHPTPMHDDRWLLRLAEHVGADGKLSKAGEKALLNAVQKAKEQAAGRRCDELLAFVTSAIRDADNGAAVLRRVREQTGVDLQVLTGEDEARLTFLAVRRWFGWSAGRLLVLDIGGGSLELANGVDEDPEVALSVPLGAGEPELAVATSKTFRTLARLTGAAPYAAGLRVPREMTATGLSQVIGFVSRIESAALAELQGVSAQRAHQVPAGAVVAQAAMRAVDVTSVRICPWALREGIILRRLDQLEGA